MKNLSRLSKDAAIEFTLNGKTLKFRPLEINDAAHFGQYLRNQRIKDAQNLLENDDELRKEIVRDLLKNGLPAGEVEKEMLTPSGILYMLWRSALTYQKDITLDDISSLCTIKNQEELTDLVLDLLGVQSDEESPFESSETQDKETPAS